MAAAAPAAGADHCTAAANHTTDELPVAGILVTRRPECSASIPSSTVDDDSGDNGTGKDASGNACGPNSARAGDAGSCSTSGSPSSGGTGSRKTASGPSCSCPGSGATASGPSGSGPSGSGPSGSGPSGSSPRGGTTGNGGSSATGSTTPGTGSRTGGRTAGSCCCSSNSRCGRTSSKRTGSTRGERGGEEGSPPIDGQCTQALAHHRAAQPRRRAAEDGHQSHQEWDNWHGQAERRGGHADSRPGSCWRLGPWSSCSPRADQHGQYHTTRRRRRIEPRELRRRPARSRRGGASGFSGSPNGGRRQLKLHRRGLCLRFKNVVQRHEIQSTWEDPVFNKITCGNPDAVRHPLDTHNIGSDPELEQKSSYHGVLRLHTEYYRLPRKHKEVDKLMKKVRLHMPYHDKTISRYDIFTDGSAEDDNAAWGFVVFAVHERNGRPPFHTLCGYLGGSVPEQLTQDALAGEIWALAMAKCWWYERCDTYGWRNVLFRVDNQAALKVAEGHSALPEHHPAAQVLAHVQRLLPPQMMDWEHVKAHSSVAGNEMADIIAGTAREHKGWFYDSSQRLEPYIYDDQLGTKYLSRVHVFRNVEYANFNEDIEKPHVTIDVDEMAKDLTRAQVEFEKDKAPSYALNIASINVKSALDKNGSSCDLGLNLSKRSEQLRTEYEKAGYSIIGMQETRTSGPTSRSNAKYHVHCSGRDEGTGKNFGCEIWIAKTLTSQNGIDFTLSANATKMVLAEPRALMVSVTAPGLSMDIACLHAPCRGPSNQEAVSDYWQDITQKVLTRRRNRVPLIVLMDANCEMGADGVHTGNLAENDDIEHPIFGFMQANNIYLPHTIAEYNCKDKLEPTFYGTDQPTCLDYIGLSMENWDNVKAEVAHDVDVSLSSIDHIPAVVRLSTRSRANKVYKNRRQLPYDIEAVRDPGNRKRVKKVLLSVQPVPWLVEPSSHYHSLAKDINTKLAEEFPKKRRKTKPWWMTAATRLCLDRKRASFMRLLQLRREEAQKVPAPRPVVVAVVGNSLDHFATETPAVAECPEAHQPQHISQAHAEHKRHVRALRQQVRADQRDGVAKVQKEVADSFNDNDLKTAFQRLRQMVPYRTPPSNMVLDEMGRPVRDQQEASGVWLRHWARSLSGKITTFKDSITSHINSWFANDTENSALEVPTPDAIGYEVSQAKPKAHGEDLIHADVWKSCPGAAGRILHPLVCKCSMYGAEPYLWAGDCRIGIPKPGKPATNPANLRGVALQCSAAKAYHKEARRGLAASVKEAVPETTYGGIAGRSSEAAIHMQVQFCEHARRTGRSAAVVFIDLSAAFDKIRRSDLPAALPPGRQANTVIAAHRCAWLSTPFADMVVEVPDGLKQGDPISDISFVSIMQMAIDQMHTEFQDLGLEVSFKHGARGSFFTFGAQEETETNMSNIVYIDDLSLMLMADNANDLIHRINTAATIATDRLRDRGFEVNFSVGKTECTYLLQGQHARDIKAELYQNGNAITLGKGDVLRLVPSYKHLGCQHAFRGAGSMIAKRAADAFMYTMQTLTIPMLKNPLLQHEHKKFLVDISLSRALYASAAWPILTPGNYRTMEKSYHKLIRTVGDAGWRHGRNPIGNEQLPSLGFQSLATHLRIRRLRYAARMCAHGAPQLAALLARNHEDYLADEQSELSWYAQLERDLSWLKKASTKLEDMPEPTQNLSAWANLMTKYPKAWKDIVGLAYKQTCGTELDWGSAEQSLQDEDEYLCSQCNRFFRTWQGYQLHRKQRHGRQAPARKYAPPSHQCCSCGTTYAHRSRLMQHWRAGMERHGPGSCFGQMLLANYSPQPDEVVERLEEEEKQRRQANRKRGWHPDKTDIPALKAKELRSKVKLLGPLPSWAYG
eukprot:TRINITY_DN36997_c1_g4_i1.p1 TRINITY_DN36997_c1_g4~~TRINITY_DN36997_c1_g4_i1.p1  ORF type:complete len:2122 (-),score=334.54 TRINITY_DN36997_c1_g4_i1:545-6133(-)